MMTHLFDDTLSVLLVFGGIIVSVLAMIISGLQQGRAATIAHELINVALEGRIEEARVHARNAGRAMQPILKALNGEVSPPSTRSYLQDFGWMLALYTAPGLLIIHAWTTLQNRDPSMRVATASALFIGLAILIPLSLAASVFIVVTARRSARIVRSHCIRMVAKQLKSIVDKEAAEALRRGTHPRDPRGE